MDGLISGSIQSFVPGTYSYWGEWTNPLWHILITSLTEESYIKLDQAKKRTEESIVTVQRKKKTKGKTYNIQMDGIRETKGIKTE